MRHGFQIVVSAAKAGQNNGVTMVAQALAFSLFLTIPAALAVALGLFSLLGTDDAVSDLVDRIEPVVPSEAAALINDSLDRATDANGRGVVLVVVGLAVALWTTTSAAASLSEAIARANATSDARSFVRRRLSALAIVATLGLAMSLVVVLMIFGPLVERWVGDRTGTRAQLDWAWWIVQWPVLILALLTALTVPLYNQAPTTHARRRHVLPGAATATALWLVLSAGFSLYVAHFGSYDATWGSLSAVAVTLIWLWLTSLAVLFGAELNAELERANTYARTDANPPTDGRHGGRAP